MLERNIVAASLCLMACASGTLEREEDTLGEMDEVQSSSAPATCKEGAGLSFDPGALPEVERSLWRGINFGNRLEAPSEGAWGPVILDGDAQLVKDRGFDHVRIPVRFSAHAEDEEPYTIDCAFFQRVDDVLAMALRAELSVVLTMLHYDELALDPERHRPRFVALWAQVAERYRSLPDRIAFELYGLAAGTLNPFYDELMSDSVAAVRTHDERRLLIVEPPESGSATALEAFDPPDDDNLMAGLLAFEPTLFTLQGQEEWAGPEYATRGVAFPGPPTTPLEPVGAARSQLWAIAWFDDYNTLAADENPSGPATLDRETAAIDAFRQRTGLDVYAAEIGCFDTADPESRVEYITQMRQALEAIDVGWAVWEDGGEHQMFDGAEGTFTEAVIGALLP